MGEIGVIKGKFVDRGDPAAYDKTASDFINDTNPHDFDLSAIVPAGAKAVLLLVDSNNNTAATYVDFKKKANSNYYNVSRITTSAANIPISLDLICPIGSDGKITYRTSGGAFNSINLVVKGWWI